MRSAKEARNDGRFFTRPQRGLRPLVPRIYRKLLTAREWRLAPSRLARLERNNRELVSSVLGDADATVSLTTHGERVETVALVIESIAAGSVRPKRLILWLDDEGAFRQLPDNLRRLQARGLEVKLTRNYGPHTKYFPFVQQMNDAGDGYLVTADDDMVLPAWWLRKLLGAAQQDPTAATCYRAHTIKLNDNGFEPYREWGECWSNLPSSKNFLTGVSGAAYSGDFVRALRSYGDAFMELCPRADDVWLNYVALVHGFKIRQVGKVPRKFATVPGSQSIGLFHSNVHGHGNDPQIAKTYDDDAVRVLQDALRAESQ